MQSITTREWNRIAADFKSVIDGQHHIMEYDPEHGSCLVPVDIDDENGLEMGLYTFEEMHLRYRLVAYSAEKAKEIAARCGHDPALMQNMRRVKSLCEKGVNHED